jgi:hypothetical protein
MLTHILQGYLIWDSRVAVSVSTSRDGLETYPTSRLVSDEFSNVSVSATEVYPRPCSTGCCYCAGQRYGAAVDRVSDSTTAATSRLFLAGYDSGSGQANGLGGINGYLTDGRRPIEVEQSG